MKTIKNKPKKCEFCINQSNQGICYKVTICGACLRDFNIIFKRANALLTRLDAYSPSKIINKQTNTGIPLDIQKKLINEANEILNSMGYKRIKERLYEDKI